VPMPIPRRPSTSRKQRPRPRSGPSRICQLSLPFMSPLGPRRSSAMLSTAHLNPA
jgi:hypothetical protein